MKIGKYRLIDMIMPAKWLAALKSMAYEWGRPDKAETPEELLLWAELVVYRSVLCKKCTQNPKGECVHCGCPVPNVFLDIKNYDSEGNWGSTTLPKWKEEKEKLGIEFNINYTKL